MVKILGFSGRKESGKSTSSNFIHGYQMKAFGVIDDFALTQNGELMVRSESNGEPVFTKLDVRRQDSEFVEWAAYNMWPFVKNYSFAQPLKAIAVELFGIKPEQAYGTNKQKNEKVKHLKWENMPGVVTKKTLKKEWGNMLCDYFPKDSEYESSDMKEGLNRINLTYHAAGSMTAREFLQFLGTEVFRKMYDDVWAEYLVKLIQNEAPLLAVVDDIRFENEIDSIHNAGGKVIRLTRSTHEDSHDSETNLDNYDGFDATIDNTNMEILDTNKEIIRLLESWDWFGEPVETKSKPQPTGGVTQIKATK